MIDIENANIEFNKYVSQFNPNKGRIKLKIDHIKRVSIMSKKIAQNLHLNEDQIKLAELIGLFHDIGRFKQAELYNTFNDRNSNYRYIKSNSDQIPIFYAYVFDFYFDFSLKFLKEKQYLDKFTYRIYDNFTNDTVKQQVNQI